MIAAVLLVVFAALGVVLWRAFLAASGRGTAGRATTASAGALAMMLAVLSLVTVMANIQGAVAPFASLLPMLVVGGTGGELTDTLDQLKQRLADSMNTGHQSPPALAVVISEYSRYHLAMTVVAAVVAVTLIGLTVVSWRRVGRPSSDSRTRRVIGSLAVSSAVLSLVVIIVAVANTTTAADPAPALLAFFNGGW